MLTALDETLSAIANQKADREAAYRDLVTQLADDEVADATATVQIVTAAGRTLADLQADVLRLRERRGALEMMQQLPAAQQAVRGADAELQRLKDEREAAIKQYDRKIRAATEARDDAAAEVRRLEEGKPTLQRTASQQLIDRRDRLQDNRHALDEIQGLRDRVARLQARVAEPIRELSDSDRKPNSYAPEEQNRLRRVARYEEAMRSRDSAAQELARVQSLLRAAEDRARERRLELAEVEAAILEPSNW